MTGGIKNIPPELDDRATSETLDRVAEAIERAQCPNREGPFGLYDYTSYGNPVPHHVRDFRNPLDHERWGKAALTTTDRDQAERVFRILTRRHIAFAAVTEAQGEASAALRDVAAERRRQVEAEGWTLEHDDAHGSGELAKAAACYAVGWRIRASNMPVGGGFAERWIWPQGWSFNPSDRRRELVKAAAMIVAEIERLDRKAQA